LAVAALSAGTAFAQTFTCSNPTITPNNSFTITCNPQAAPVAGAGGTFTLGGPASLTTGTSGSVTINRSGGTTGTYSLTATASGACSGSAAPTFAENGGTSTSFTVTAGGSAGTCTVALGSLQLTAGSPSPGATLGSNLTIAVNAPAPPPPPPVAGCPT